MRNGLNPEESKASQITDKAIFWELLLTPAQGDWGVLEAAVTGPEAGVPPLKQIHHKLLNPHIWRQFSVSSKPNGSAAMAGNWIIRSSVGKKELAQSYSHRPGDRNLKQNLIAMRQWWRVLRRSICHLRYLGLCLQMCHLQIPEMPSVKSSSRGQMFQGRETLETQTCSVTQLSPQSKTEEFTSLLSFFYLGTIN